MGDDEASRVALERAKTILDCMLSRQLRNITWRGVRAQMATATAGRLSEKDPSLKPKVFEAARVAYAIATANARDNPDDKSTLDNASVMTTRLANQLFRDQSQRPASIPLFLEAKDISDRLVECDPSNRRNRYLQMNNRLLLGAMYGETGDWKTGLVYTDKAERMVDEILAKSPTDLVTEDNKVTVFIKHHPPRPPLRPGTPSPHYGPVHSLLVQFSLRISLRFSALISTWRKPILIGGLMNTKQYLMAAGLLAWPAFGTAIISQTFNNTGSTGSDSNLCAVSWTQTGNRHRRHARTFGNSRFRSLISPREHVHDE